MGIPDEDSRQQRTAVTSPISESRRLLGQRLRERRPEIEQAVLTRMNSVAGNVQVRDQDYLEGRWTALQAALNYCLDAVEQDGDRPPPLPDALLTQVRLAARYRVSLDV